MGSRIGAVAFGSGFIAAHDDAAGSVDLTASRFSFSEDRKLLLFDGNSEVQTGKSNLALYVFDFDKHSLSRITSETFEASHPRWLPTGKGIVFLRLEETPDDRAIFDVCVTSLDDHKVTTILKNTSSVSYSVE